MPDTKISALTTLAKASIDIAADLVPVVDTSAAETKRATVSDFVKSVFDPASPGPIGGTTPAAGTFTTLTATDQAAFTKGSATGALNVSPTWNDAGINFAAIYSRVTNTASGGSSRLIDLGTVAAGSLFTVDKSGYAKAIQFAVNGTTSSLDANCRVQGSVVIDSGYLAFNVTQTVRIQRGAGSPEGVITASVGSLYLRTDGGASSTLYVKESGTGNTGWVAK